MWLSSILWLLLGLARGSVAGDVRKSISRHPRGSAGGGWQRRNSTAPPGERPLPARAHTTSVRFGTEKQIKGLGWMLSPDSTEGSPHHPAVWRLPGPAAWLAQSTRRLLGRPRLHRLQPSSYTKIRSHAALPLRVSSQSTTQPLRMVVLNTRLG